MFLMRMVSLETATHGPMKAENSRSKKSSKAGIWTSSKGSKCIKLKRINGSDFEFAV